MQQKSGRNAKRNTKLLVFTTTYLSSLHFNTFTKYKPRKVKIQFIKYKIFTTIPSVHFKILKEYKETKIQKKLSTKYKMKKKNYIPAVIAFQRNLNHKSRMKWTKQGWDKRAVKQMCSVYHTLYSIRGQEFKIKTFAMCENEILPFVLM